MGTQKLLVRLSRCMEAVGILPSSVAEPADDQLMSRLKSGDGEAFALLVDRHKDALVAYLGRLTASPDRAEELAQETFVRLFEKAALYRGEGKLAAYLYRIATNLVRSEERRRRRWRLLVPRYAVENTTRREPDAQQQVLGEELRRRLARAVAELPLNYRVPLVLFEVEGWRLAEIARLLGCREGTIKSRLHRARGRLRSVLSPYYGEV